MQKTSEAISDALGIEHEIEIVNKTPAVINEPEVPQAQTHTTIDEKEDYEFARRTIKELVEKGKEALDNAIDLADAYEKPSAYDAIANLIKTMTDSTKELYNLQKTSKEVKSLDRKVERSADLGGSGINVEKAVFVGTTAELLQQLKTNVHNK